MADDNIQDPGKVTECALSKATRKHSKSRVKSKPNVKQDKVLVISSNGSGGFKANGSG